MKTLDLAIGVEETIAEIYGQFAYRFREDPELRALFVLLREEELSHARRIGAFREEQELDRLGEGANSAFLESLFRGILGETEAMLLKALSGQSLSSEEALARSLELERDFHSVHAEAFARSRDSELAPLFEELVRGDLAHQKMLEEIAARRGVTLDGEGF